MTNRLISETSPYLLQHADNPVEWYPWCDEAFERASAEDKPVLLSIGYSACHWCHVMERESFENPATARLMNDSFINIKVDREERPDLDAVYMSAVQATTGSGGWPMTVFLTPDRRPFFGGTYFPPEDRGNLPGFPRVLQTVADAYHNRREQVESTAGEIVEHLSRTSDEVPSKTPLTSHILELATGAMNASYDPRNGGFGSAPKFPQAMAFDFLLRRHRSTEGEKALEMTEHTLQRMAAGGIRDHVGGGFHRYSVDAQWLVPHFEKMLYDNALLARVYLHAYQVTGEPLYRRVLEEILDYVLRDMADPFGGFYSTQDADSEGVEGKYYTWTLAEMTMTDALGVDDAKLAARYYGATERGNFEGANILHRPVASEALAASLKMPVDELEARMAVARRKLLAKRKDRVPPHRDEKVLADWNGMMLGALSESAAALERLDYLQSATDNAAFLMDKLYDGKTLMHVWKDGQAKLDGYLADYALVADGLIALYRATLDPRWLETAIELAEHMLRLFWDDSKGVFYDVPAGREELFVRPRDFFDNATPSGSSAAVLVLLRLSAVTGNTKYEQVAARAMEPVAEYMRRYPLGFGNWLCALDFYLADVKEIAVVGPLSDPATQALLREVHRRYLPCSVLAGGPDQQDSEADTPLLRDRPMVDGKPTAYVCAGHVCQPPVNDADSLALMLDR